ncbi:MAG: hypothetical protein ACREJV_04585, partial [Candidatus Rokuibacteriota bacterium]
MAEPLPRDIARLYAVPLKDFVKARDALAAKLRELRRLAEAADVGKLRKPTPTVWAINRVAREDPAVVTRFVEAVNHLKRAHLGEPGRLARATEEQRSALERLLERAKGVLAEAGLQASAAVTSRISATLLGAAADPHASSDLRQGRLTHERQAPGFEALVGAAATGKALRDDALRAAEAEARDAKRRAEETEQVAAQHRQVAERAAREAQDLRQRLQAAEQRARDARRATEE